MKKNQKVAKKVNVVKIVSKVVSKGIGELSLLEKKGKKIISAVKKEWKDIEPKRKALENNAKKIIKKNKKAIGEIIDKTIQFEKDIKKGIKLGLNKTKKK